MADIIPSVRSRDEKIYNPDAEFLSLQIYHSQAKKIICRFCSPSVIRIFLKNEDVISQVAEKLMEADWRYREDMGAKRGTYRVHCGRWAIKTLLKKLNKNAKYKNLPDGKHVDSLSAFHISKDKSKNLSTNSEPLKEDIENELNLLDKSLCEYFLKCSNITDKQEGYLRMKYLENMTNKQIAETFNTSSQNVQSIISKGVAIMQEYTREMYRSE